MNKGITAVIALVAGLAAGIPVGGRLMPAGADDEGAPVATTAAVIPDEVGTQDLFGAYDVVPNWPKNISSLPGHEAWTFGAGQGIFAENPNRVYLVSRGELPNIKRPQARLFPDVGPNVQFPIGGLPWRSATQVALPGAGGAGGDPAKGFEIWRGSQPPYRELGKDARWEHCLIVVDGAGNIIEEWTQWDKIFKRPHSVYISPYDPEKHVWLVDDHMHAIYKFTNDGKQLVQTIGTPETPGADGTHFNRPTFMAWDSDGSFYVADGYNGTRVAKFDKDGKFLLQFGQAGDNSGEEKRPGYMNNVHGVAVDVATHRVFVNDRQNHRIQIFDANGQYQSEWAIKQRPSSLHLIQIGDDGHLVTFDQGTQRMLKYDLDGRLIYSWGTAADLPGSLWGVHGIATDQQGNLYTAEVNAGRFQKFTPRQGANPNFLVGKPIYSAWQ
jgi:sugar lactone lactonase YvrE